MVNKEELKQLILLNLKFQGELKLSYIPESVIHDIEECGSLYYGGWRRIELGQSYHRKGEFVDITDDNIDTIVDEIYDVLSNSIGNEILQALENLEWEAEELKYFDRDKKAYNKFKKEVLRLKEESKKNNN